MVTFADCLIFLLCLTFFLPYQVSWGHLPNKPLKLEFLSQDFSWEILVKRQRKTTVWIEGISKSIKWWALGFGWVRKTMWKGFEGRKLKRPRAWQYLWYQRARPDKFGRERSLEEKETVVVGLAMADCTLGTPRSRNQWSKDKISSIGLWTGLSYHLSSKAHPFWNQFSWVAH